MPAIDLSDRDLFLLARLADMVDRPELARKLRANTFEARGMAAPSPALVHVARADK